MPVSVAVTGPTGEIGRALLRSLDAEPEVDRVLGMARRPFDPAEAGLSEKVEYRRGDVLDRDGLDELFAGVDVVVHLAFIIIGRAEETHEINLVGSRHVFAAAVAAGAQRLVYTSSVAAYGFHADNPQPLTEAVEPRGSTVLDYSAHKAELESVLRDSLSDRSTPQPYVFRPCVVAGPDALALIANLPYVQAAKLLPEPLRGLISAVPYAKPYLPDPGTPMQLVHHDDVASALTAAVLGRGEPGPYNLAAPGELTVTDLAHALGWYTTPVPKAALHATAEAAARAPLLPAIAQWLEVLRVPVLMDCSRAREQLGWQPAYDAAETLAQTVASAREARAARRRHVELSAR